MSRTIEDIQKDIELLGIKGGYDIEQLLTPQDCRRLSYEIERLHSIIKEAREYIKDVLEYEGKEYTRVIRETLIEILDKEKDNERRFFNGNE